MISYDLTTFPMQHENFSTGSYDFPCNIIFHPFSKKIHIQGRILWSSKSKGSYDSPRRCFHPSSKPLSIQWSVMSLMTRRWKLSDAWLRADFPVGDWVTGWRVVDPMIKDRMLFASREHVQYPRWSQNNWKRYIIDSKVGWEGGYGTVPRITYVKSCSKNLQMFNSSKNLLCILEIHCLSKKEGYDWHWGWYWIGIVSSCFTLWVLINPYDLLASAWFPEVGPWALLRRCWCIRWQRDPPLPLGETHAPLVEGKGCQTWKVYKDISRYKGGVACLSCRCFIKYLQKVKIFLPPSEINEEFFQNPSLHWTPNQLWSVCWQISSNPVANALLLECQNNIW